MASRGALTAFLVFGCAADEGHQASSHSEDHPPLLCDRATAREARKAIKDMLIPLARSYGAEMSASCPLHKDHDRLFEHEAKKKTLSQFQYRCEICGKMFRSERYIDMHMDRKHLDTLPTSATTCLGEFCDILRCSGWIKGLKAHLRDDPAACVERDLESRRHFCQHLMHDCFMPQNRTVRAARPRCVYGVRRPFDATSSSDTRSHRLRQGHAVFESLDEQLCGAFTCKWREQLRHDKELPQIVNGKHASGASGGGLGATILTVLLVLVLAGGYMAFYCWYREINVGRGDLMARSNRRRSVSWFKSKAY